MTSPYDGLPPERFWRTGVTEAHPLSANLYRKKFDIAPADRIATAGSCFAQHVATHLRASGFSVMDIEPAPSQLPPDQARAFGYGIYSARYGNIYAVRQLLQLARDAETGFVDAADVWEKDGRFYDALRPNVEPRGVDTVDEVLALRRHHLRKVKQLFSQMDVFVFTFGLTETWCRRETGRVYPTAPGTIAGAYDPDVFEFRNFGFVDIYNDFVEFLTLVRGWNPDLRILLTVSPVPLTATASNQHVLCATTYSKSVLRAAAGALCEGDARVDYVPSYELIASPWSRGIFYDANLRTVNAEGVAAVMRMFFAEHRPPEAAAEPTPGTREERIAANRARKRARAAEAAEDADEVVCEEVLLKAFGR